MDENLFIVQYLTGMVQFHMCCFRKTVLDTVCVSCYVWNPWDSYIFFASEKKTVLDTGGI